MYDAIESSQDPEALGGASIADANADTIVDADADDRPGSPQDRALHLLLTAWTMVLEEEQAKK